MWPGRSSVRGEASDDSEQDSDAVSGLEPEPEADRGTRRFQPESAELVSAHLAAPMICGTLF